MGWVYQVQYIPSPLTATAFFHCLQKREDRDLERSQMQYNLKADGTESKRIYAFRQEAAKGHPSKWAFSCVGQYMVEFPPGHEENQLSNQIRVLPFRDRNEHTHRYLKAPTLRRSTLLTRPLWHALAAPLFAIICTTVSCMLSIDMRGRNCPKLCQ